MSMPTELSEDISNFKYLLARKHYSMALVEFLLAKLDSASITTFQEVNDVINRDTDYLIKYFMTNNSDLELIEKKNPLCIEAMRDYLYRLFSRVYKKYGHDLKLFLEGLKLTFKNQLTSIKESTAKVAEVAYSFVEEQNYSKILVYNYSKSIKIMIKKLHKKMDNNLEVYTCQSSFIGEGKKMFTELSLEGINCTFIADAEISYYINQVDCVLTGAEVVLADGSILNRTGTYMLGLCAREAKKPMLCLAESYKFINKVFLTQRDIPYHMLVDENRKEPLVIADLTYGKCISLFCTDIGCLNPESVSFRIGNMLN